MTVTLGELITAVNNEVENNIERGFAETTGDGVSTSFLIAPNFRYILDNEYFGCWVDGVYDTTGWMDYDSGIYTFPTAPADSGDPEAPTMINWEFQYVYWRQPEVINAIYYGINSLFPDFYKTETETQDCDGTEKEFTLTTEGIEDITYVMRSETDEDDWGLTSPTRYSVYPIGSTRVVRFFTAPSEGELRFHLITRAGLPPTTEDTIDIPDRASGPIVSYACYHLLNQKTAPRIRNDIALATTGGGWLSPRQLNDASNSFLLRYQMQVGAMRMRPWSKT